MPTISSTRTNFYPRPPWGGRQRLDTHNTKFHKFLSTPSVGRATRSRVSPVIPSPFLSTPSVGRATSVGVQAKSGVGLFLSTPSVGRATKICSLQLHGLRDFYPRPPWGGRPALFLFKISSMLFLSTPSVGRATPHRRGWCPSACHFYPRPPWGGRPSPNASRSALFRFLSTPSVGRATAKVHKNPVYLLRKGYNYFPAGRCNLPRSGKTSASTFNNLAAKC